MARAGKNVHRTTTVAGHSSAQVERSLVAAISDDAHYSCVASGPAAYRLVRTFRPTWATIAGVGGLPVVGLGILFFLVRRTETCTLTIVDASTGVVVAVSGALLPETLAAMWAALEPSAHGLRFEGHDEPVSAPPGKDLAPCTSAASPEPLAAASLNEAQEPDGLTVMRSVPAPSGPGWAARFASGDAIDLSTPLVLGRDPSPLAEIPDARLWPIVDPDRSASKTHAVIGADEHGAWIEDLRSTNGTAIESPGGQARRIEPGVRIALTSGTIVTLGTSTLVVARG